MSGRSDVVIDFVARGESPDEYRMVLVEDGPWIKPYTPRIAQLQQRLYSCVEAAIDGQLAAKFPESTGKRIIIQVDCYNAPRADIESFFTRFSEGILLLDDYQRALRESRFIKGIGFSISFDTIN